MPSLSRRREHARGTDVRDGRFESEIRIPEKERAEQLMQTRKGLRFCRRCSKALEEYSVTCPGCDKKDEMGWLRPFREGDREHNREKAVELSRARLRARGLL